MKKVKLTENPLFKFLVIVLLPLLVLLLSTLTGGSYYESVLALFFINVILAASLNLTNGITGIFSQSMSPFTLVIVYTYSFAAGSAAALQPGSVNTIDNMSSKAGTAVIL